MSAATYVGKLLAGVAGLALSLAAVGLALVLAPLVWVVRRFAR